MHSENNLPSDYEACGECGFAIIAKAAPLVLGRKPLLSLARSLQYTKTIPWVVYPSLHDTTYGVSKRSPLQSNLE